ncbi:hypothetical protein [Amphritea sp.]|uniref:beta family protein n=1 Tax=Amphritea sp. TaxID=1872502 RepID=UPI0025C15660|nr:hypothetical protein [Amphritea sp.]
MSQYKYFPVIKTRDAELRCFKNISNDLLDDILPTYELTKSRKTTKTPDGDIHRRMKQIGEIQGDKPFILDLCTDDKYINPQIEQLIDEFNGFVDWQYFINLYSNLNIIPMVHLYEDSKMEFSEVESFVKKMSVLKSHLAVRLPYDLDASDLSSYLSPIVNNLAENCKLYVLLDADYIRHDAKADVEIVSNLYVESALAVHELGDKIEDIVMICTSFPSSPAQEGNGDAEGEFDIYEEVVFREVCKKYPIKYGDYASINTEQIEIKGGTFVPRIDVAIGDKFIYKRYRRDKGSYPLCAKKMVADGRYVSLGVWADKEIELAHNDEPTGISPSFWISVRMNYYIATRVKLRSELEIVGGAS